MPCGQTNKHFLTENYENDGEIGLNSPTKVTLEFSFCSSLSYCFIYFDYIY